MLYCRLILVHVLNLTHSICVRLETVSHCGFWLLPSGTTPQRREFVYPRQLVKFRRRSELLESLRRKQEELQAAVDEEEEDEELEEEDKQSQVDLVCFQLYL